MKSLIIITLASISFLDLFGWNTQKAEQPIEETPIFCTEARELYNDGRIEYDSAQTMIEEHLEKLQENSCITSWEKEEDGESYVVETSLGTTFCFKFTEKGTNE